MDRLFRKDLLAAGLMTVIGLLVMHDGYRDVRNLTQPADSTLASIPSGPFMVGLFSNGSCFARFDGSLEQKAGQFILKGTGSTSIQFQGREVRPTIESEFVFNSLGQLGGTVIRIRIGEDGFVLGTLNVNPIMVQARSLSAGASPPVQVSVPGPVLIARNSDGTYRIIYEHSTRAGAFPLPIATQPVIERLKLAARLGSPAMVDCPAETLHPLDLTSIAQAATAFNSRFPIPFLTGS